MFPAGRQTPQKCRGWRRRAGAVDGKQCQRTTGCSKRQAQSFVCSHANRQGGNLDPVDRLEVDDDSSVVLWRRPLSLFSLLSLPWQVTERAHVVVLTVIYVVLMCHKTHREGGEGGWIEEERGSGRKREGRIE